MKRKTLFVSGKRKKKIEIIASTLSNPVYLVHIFNWLYKHVHVYVLHL